MVDPIEALERAMQVALTIAEDRAQKPGLRLQAVSATTRAASALAAVGGAQSDRQRKDLEWASETIQCTERLQSPEVRLLGITPTAADGLRHRLARQMIADLSQIEQGTPDW